MNGLLLDTHVFIWWSKASSRLSKETHKTINSHPKVYLSSVVAWEIEILQFKGKISGEPFDWPMVLKERVLIPLPISISHTTEHRTLPMIHKDPFDRMLIAQAKQEGLTLLTRDRDVMKYEGLGLMEV